MSTELVTSALDTALFLHDLRHRRREQALTDLAAFAHACGTVRDPDRLRVALQRRERSYSSAVGRGVAIPHARSLVVNVPHVLIGRAPRGIDWRARDGQAVQLVLAVLAPHDLSIDSFLDLLGHAAEAARLQRRRQRLLSGDRSSVESAWREAS